MIADTRTIIYPSITRLRALVARFESAQEEAFSEQAKRDGASLEAQIEEWRHTFIRSTDLLECFAIGAFWGGTPSKKSWRPGQVTYSTSGVVFTLRESPSEPGVTIQGYLPNPQADEVIFNLTHTNKCIRVTDGGEELAYWLAERTLRLLGEDQGEV